MEPTAVQERIMALDVIRGLAVVGMFTVNMSVDLPGADIFRDQPIGILDTATMVLVDFFANGKFLTLFSILFGVGFVVQAQRAGARALRFPTLYVRRLLGLLLIGSVAVILGITGDILVLYALFGFVLLALRNRSTRTILAAAFVCLGLVFFLNAVSPLLANGSTDADVVATQLTQTERTTLYTTGTFREIISYRAARFVAHYAAFGFIGDLDILGLMLLGVYVGRRGVFQNAGAQRGFVRVGLVWTALVGLVGMSSYILLEHIVQTGESGVLASLRNLSIIGAFALGFAYGAAALLAVERHPAGVFAPLSAMGRLALTNYLLQGTIIALITYNYGLGLYGRVGPSAGLVVAVLFLPGQALLSMWWLRRYRLGPMEWLWRGLTYRHLPSLRLRTAPP